MKVFNFAIKTLKSTAKKQMSKGDFEFALEGLGRVKLGITNKENAMAIINSVPAENIASITIEALRPLTAKEKKSLAYD